MALFAAAVAVGVLAGSWMLGGQMTRTYPRAVGAPPADLHAEAVELHGAWGRLGAWRAGDFSDRACVLLLHGLGGDRRDMVSRARMLTRAGYGVLLIDQQGHGESDGDAVAFGARSRWDAVQGVTALRGWGCARVGVIGVSMGGAAALLAAGDLEADAVVVEQVYATLDEAADERLVHQVGLAAPVVRHLLMWQLGPRLGVWGSDSRPVDRIAGLSSPVLVIAGQHDVRAPPEAAQRLLDAAGGPAERWVVADAGHESLHHRLGPAYEDRVLRFLSKWLAPRS